MQHHNPHQIVMTFILSAWSSPTCMWQSTPTSEKQFKDWSAGNHHHHHHHRCHQSWLNPPYFNLTELHSNVNTYQVDINLENLLSSVGKVFGSGFKKFRENIQFVWHHILLKLINYDPLFPANQYFSFHLDGSPPHM